MASTKSPSSSSRPAYSSTAASLVSGGVRNGFSEAKASHSSTVPNARWSCANVGEVKRLSGFRGGAEPRVKEDQTDPFLVDSVTTWTSVRRSPLLQYSGERWHDVTRPYPSADPAAAAPAPPPPLSRPKKPTPYSTRSSPRHSRT